MKKNVTISNLWVCDKFALFDRFHGYNPWLFIVEPLRGSGWALNLWTIDKFAVHFLLFCLCTIGNSTLRAQQAMPFVDFKIGINNVNQNNPYYFGTYGMGYNDIGFYNGKLYSSMTVVNANISGAGSLNVFAHTFGKINEIDLQNQTFKEYKSGYSRYSGFNFMPISLQVLDGQFYQTGNMQIPNASVPHPGILRRTNPADSIFSDILLYIRFPNKIVSQNRLLIYKMIVKGDYIYCCGSSQIYGFGGFVAKIPMSYFDQKNTCNSCSDVEIQFVGEAIYDIAFYGKELIFCGDEDNEIIVGYFQAGTYYHYTNSKGIAAQFSEPQATSILVDEQNRLINILWTTHHYYSTVGLLQLDPKLTPPRSSPFYQNITFPYNPLFTPTLVPSTTPCPPGRFCPQKPIYTSISYTPYPAHMIFDEKHENILVGGYLSSQIDTKTTTGTGLTNYTGFALRYPYILKKGPIDVIYGVANLRNNDYTTNYIYKSWAEQDHVYMPRVLAYDGYNDLYIGYRSESSNNHHTYMMNHLTLDDLIQLPNNPRRANCNCGIDSNCTLYPFADTLYWTSFAQKEYYSKEEEEYDYTCTSYPQGYGDEDTLLPLYIHEEYPAHCSTREPQDMVSNDCPYWIDSIYSVSDSNTTNPYSDVFCKYETKRLYIKPLSCFGQTTYQWTLNGKPIEKEGTDSFYIAKDSGTYSLSATRNQSDGSQCTFNFKSRTLYSPVVPYISIMNKHPNYSCDDTRFSIQAYPDTMWNYDWYGGDFVWITYNTVSINSPNYYHCVVSMDNGCIDTAHITIHKTGIDIAQRPTKINPNRNDTFSVSMLVRNYDSISKRDTLVYTVGSYMQYQSSAGWSYDSASRKATCVLTLPARGKDTTGFATHDTTTPPLKLRCISKCATHGTLSTKYTGLCASISFSKDTMFNQANVMPAALLSVYKNTKCNGDTITLRSMPLSKIAPLKYYWYRNDTLIDSSQTPPYTAKTTASYALIVKDSGGCLTEKSTPLKISISQPITLTPKIVQPLCAPLDSGMISYTDTQSIKGGIAPFQFLWQDSTKLNAKTKLGAGIYSYKITDSIGCFVSRVDTLKYQKAVAFAVHTVQPAYCNRSQTGKITVDSLVGDAPFSYSINRGTTTQTLPIVLVRAGLDTITVSDKNNCAATKTYVLDTQNRSLSLRDSIALLPLCSKQKGTIVVYADSASGTTLYTLNGKVSTVSPQIFTSLDSGNYLLKVADSKGCVDSLWIHLPLDSFPKMSYTAKIDSATCALADGAITLSNFTGKNPPIAFQWNTGGSATTRSNLNVGCYKIALTDASGCVRNDSICIPPKASTLSAAISVYIQNCTSATIVNKFVAKVQGGTPPYTYAWGTSQGGAAASTDSSFASSTRAYVTITDANGCTLSLNAANRALPTNSAITVGSGLNTATKTGYENRSNFTALFNSSGNYLFNQLIINGKFNIDANTTFQNCEILVRNTSGNLDSIIVGKAGVGLALYNCYIHTCTDELYGGIALTDANAVLQITASTIEDMTTAVKLNAPKHVVLLKDNLFRNNLNGISILGKISSLYTSSCLAIPIVGNYFKGGALKPLASTTKKRSEAGILIGGSSAVTIGSYDLNCSANIFDSLQCGINAGSVTCNIVNFQMRNIGKCTSCANPYAAPSGIYSNATAATKLIVVGLGASAAPTFQNVNTAITVKGTRLDSLIKCNFSNVDTGLKYSSPTVAGNLNYFNVQNNAFSTNTSAIYYNQDNANGANLQFNIIGNQFANPANTNLNATTVYLRHQKGNTYTNLLQYNTFAINTNKIAIEVHNTHNINSSNNNITMNAPATQEIGIYFDSCKNIAESSDYVSFANSVSTVNMGRNLAGYGNILQSFAPIAYLYNNVSGGNFCSYAYSITGFLMTGVDSFKLKSNRITSRRYGIAIGSNSYLSNQLNMGNLFYNDISDFHIFSATPLTSGSNHFTTCYPKPKSVPISGISTGMCYVDNCCQTVYPTPTKISPIVSGTDSIMRKGGSKDSICCWSLPKIAMISNDVVQPQTELTCTLFPNPATNHFYLQFSEVPESALEVLIFDQSGRLVQKHEDLHTEKTKMTFDVSHLARSTYFIRVFYRGKNINDTQLKVGNDR